jgi:hypothetical protein
MSRRLIGYPTGRTLAVYRRLARHDARLAAAHAALSVGIIAVL